MAGDRRVKYILEVDYEGESAILKAADDLREVDGAAKTAGEGLEKAHSGLEMVALGAVAAYGALGTIEEVFGKVQAAAQFAYDTLKEGAALADAREDFEGLAASIGTTADALEGRLGEAAAGLKTDAELVGQASELMALGLGLTEDEIVTLTGLAAELDWNWKTLVDTLNTGSSRGLKELGLNISEVKARAEELEAQGIATNQAFQWSIIEAGEEKIGKVGKKSEESAGQIQILETAVAQVQDEFARGAAEGFAASLSEMGVAAPAAAAGLGQLAYGLSLLTTSSLPQFLDQVPRVYEALGLGWVPAMLDAGMALGVVKGQLESTTTAEERYREVQEQAQLITEAQAQSFVTAATAGEMGQVAAADYAESQEWLARATEWVGEANERAAVADYARAQSVADLAAAQELAASAAAAWAEYTAEATARGGDYFTQISSAGPETWNLAAAIYGAADAEGAGAAALGELAVQLGLMDEATAQATTAAVMQQTIAESLAGAAATGKIPWDEYAAAVEHAIEVANGAYLIDLGPRQAPEMEDRGFREAYQESFEAATQDQPAWVVRLEGDNQAVLDAVAEAKGVVEGFASPEEAYEAVMDLDITAVQEKGEVVRGIIDGLPERKTVVIDFQATGTEILEELRAVGAIP